VNPRRPRSAGGELKCSKKRKRDDTETDDDDTADESSEDDEQEGSEMEDGSTAGGESENGEQEVEDSNNDAVADGNAVRQGSAAHTPADDNSLKGLALAGKLKADSGWPREPKREEISQLATCLDHNEYSIFGGLLEPTARDAIRNAVASVKFLNELGQTSVHPNDLGIDSAGCLFKIGCRRSTRNYASEFRDMVRALEKNGEETAVKRKVKNVLQAYLDIGDVRFVDASEGETGNLLSLVETVVKEGSFGLPGAKSVLAECEKTLAKMNSTLALINAVQLDLLETGSTSLTRLNRLCELGYHFVEWKAEDRTSGDFQNLTPHGIHRLIRHIVESVSAYQEALGVTLRLKRDLQTAIDDFGGVYRRR
jgi:hypothetical protein